MSMSTGRSAPDDHGVTFHPANLLTPADTSEVVRAAKASHLLHLAWDTTPGKFWNSPINLDWVSASLALVQAFAEQGGHTRRSGRNLCRVSLGRR